MALTLDPATRIFTVSLADLTLVGGTLYDMDTNQFRLDVGTLVASEDYIWLPTPIIHNTEVTVAGVTYARFMEMINNYSLIMTPNSASTVRLQGSNNNLFDVQNNILEQNAVQVIPNNSAGLVVIDTGSGVTPQDIIDIADATATEVWIEPVAGMTDSTTIGGYIATQVLSVAKFLGLK